MKILICDPMAEEALAPLADAGIQVDILATMDADLAEIIGQYQGLMVGQRTILSQELLAQGQALQVIGKVGKDTSNIAMEAATRQGIVIVNTSQGVSASLAEYVMLLLLSMARKPKPQRITGLGSRLMGTELKGKTLGIIGLGNVGVQVAKRAKAFDMRVVCYDPLVSRGRATIYDVEILDLVDLLIVSDFITIHAPLNDETKGLIHQDHISLMKQGVCLINTSHPDICRLSDVCDGLTSGKIQNVAIDCPEHHSDITALFKPFPQTIITEHNATATCEAQVGTATEIVAEMIRVLQDGRSPNAINMPLIKDSQQHIYQPYEQLAAILGSFLGQILSGTIEAIKLTYQGALTQYDPEPLNQTILAYLLPYVTADKINYVNAALWAAEHHIAVETTLNSVDSDYQNYIGIEVRTSTETKSIAGNIFNNGDAHIQKGDVRIQKGDARIVQIDQFSLDTKPRPYFLLVPHQNKPGMVGSVGSVLGQYHVNIAGMIVGRRDDSQQDDAIMIIAIDHAAHQDVIAAIAKIPDIYDVKSVKLNLSC